MVIPVIILNYNSVSDCRKCISFLKRQRNVKLEIIIVDNCSQKNDCEDVKQLCKEQNCTFIQASSNQGYNAGNNIGLRYACEKGYSYAMISNPDMEYPEDDYVAKTINIFCKDENIVVIGTDIIGVDNIHQNPLKKDKWTDCFDWIITPFRKQNISIHLDNSFESHYCNKVSGCSMFVSMGFIRKIGYFDENVFLYCEEAILSNQVKNENKQIYYYADAHAIHRHIKNEKGDPIKRFKIWLNSRIYYINTYSNNSWIAKKVACYSMYMYVFTFIVQSMIRQKWEIKKEKNI